MNRRDKNDGDALKPWMLADDIGNLKAVHIRHAHVHQDHGDIVSEKIFQRLAAGSRCNQVLSQSGKDRFVGEKLCWIVVNHQNVDFIVCAHRRACRRGRVHVRPLSVQPHT
jgi:hypothetical protein